MTQPRRVSVVMLAYGEEPLLSEAVHAVLDSRDVEVDVILVDNGCTSDAVERVTGLDRVTVVHPGSNTGFAAGCNLGVRRSGGDVVALVNSDAIVTDTALARLADVAMEPGVGLATSSLRLHESPELMNSAGNPVHFLGLSWAGSLGEPAAAHAVRTEVASASGAAVACRREVWDELGGFWEDLFTYCEDAELSLRVWQSGRTVVFVPDAVVTHHYEFSRNALKLYLLERNRLMMVLSLYERRTLLLLAPALVGLELVGLLVALRQGWARDKVRGWWWLLRHRRVIGVRRRQVQPVRRRSDAQLAALLTADFAPGSEAGISAPGWAVGMSRLYWRVVRALLGSGRLA